MAANIFITWTETEHTFDRWVADKYGNEERFFKSKPVTRKAYWMADVPDDAVASETAKAQQYVDDQIADGDTRNLKVKVVRE